MKVKALITYFDKELKREIRAGVIYEVESEERLKELLGANDKKLICCEVLKEAETNDTLPEDNSSVDNLPTDEVIEDNASTDESLEDTVEVTEKTKTTKKKSNAKKK